MITQSRFGGKTVFFVFDDAEAPACECGQTAAFKIGFSKNNNPYGIFVCAKSAGEDWKSKCEFSQWLPREEKE